jgi:hypothetical protein
LRHSCLNRYFKVFVDAIKGCPGYKLPSRETVRTKMLTEAKNRVEIKLKVSARNFLPQGGDRKMD